MGYPIFSAWPGPAWPGCLGSFHRHSGSLGSSRLWGLVAPSDPGVMAQLSAVLHHSYSTPARLGLSHRQTPQTRLGPPKLPQPLVQQTPTYRRLVGGVCTAVREFPAL